MSTTDIARSFIQRGWSPVPVRFKTKKPTCDAWQKLRITEADADRYFNGAKLNIGVVLGLASDGLCDADLDCPEAITAANYLLPDTGAIFGRAGSRFSHRLYRTDLARSHDVAVLEFSDPCAGKKARLLELRIGGGDKGAQTVFPGSVHESGEDITWEENGEPAEVDASDLLRRVGRVAAAALLARHWPGEGARHNAARAIGGLLARGGWSAPEAKLFIQAVAKAAGDEEWQDRDSGFLTACRRSAKVKTPRNPFAASG